MSSSDEFSDKLGSGKSHESLGDAEKGPEPMYSDNANEDGYATTSALQRTSTSASARSTHEEQAYVTRVLTGGSKKETTPLPKMGGGKDYPPELPDREPWRVDYEGDEDPLFPQNWPLKKKLITCAILGYTTFCASWGSSVFSAAVPEICAQYGVGSTVGLLTIALYIFGFASGPIIWGPMSELYGRKAPIVVSMLLFTVFNFGVAVAKDLQTIMLCRFFAGFTGAAPLAVVAAAFSDLFNNMQRGTALSLFSGMVFMAPVVAPVVGAFIASSYLKWRWTEYITGIMSALALVLDIFFYEESYHPAILARKAVELRRRTGNWGIYAPHEAVELDITEIFSKNVMRPIKMLVVEPILLLLTIYTSFIYGILYILLEAYPIIFAEGYGMTGGVSQLPYLGLAVGMFIAMLMLAFVFEPRYNKKLAANSFKPVPEARSPSMLSGAIVLPLGIFWLTWTGNYHEHVHWMVPTASGVLIGYSLISIFVSSFQYIIDSYLLFAASAIAANTILRSLVAGSVAIVSEYFFHNLGTNWAGLLLGCLAVIMAPVPLLFYFYGRRIRQKSKFAFVLD